MIASQIRKNVKMAIWHRLALPLHWSGRLASQDIPVNQTAPIPSPATDKLHLNIQHDAVKQLSTILKENQFLRVFVEGGGCSGFQYKFELDDNFDPDEDLIFNKDAAKVVVDIASLKILNGATVEYHTDLLRAGFRIKDIPQAEKGCSCGVSFSVKL